MIELLLVLFGPPIPVMSSEPVSGWPRLAITEHYVSTVEMRDRCSKYAGPMAMACSEVNMKKRECHIWLSKETPSEQLAIHERGHCKGYPHLGDGTRKQMEAMAEEYNRLHVRGTQSQAAR